MLGGDKRAHALFEAARILGRKVVARPDAAQGDRERVVVPAGPRELLGFARERHRPLGVSGARQAGREVEERVEARSVVAGCGEFLFELWKAFIAWQILQQCHYPAITPATQPASSVTRS